MSSPVWVLSVDLQTKTATFQTGMADAAKSAKNAFRDIRAAAKDGGEGVQQSAGNVRAALGLIDNTIRGNHAAAMADLVREFQDSAVVMAALPFAVAIGGIGAVAAIAVEVAAKVKEWREEQEKLTTEQTKFGTAVNESFNTLDDKILSAQQRADELSNNHLGALNKTLQLIDHASMQDLVHEFETVSKAADGTFKLLEGHWYTLGIGSAGATHALDQFKTKYDSLLSQGKDSEASDLLKGTRDSAERVLQAQKSLQGSRTGGGMMGPSVDYTAQYKALAVLKAAGVGDTKKEVESQETLLQTLTAQVTAQAKIAEIKKQDQDNAKKQTGNDASARTSAGARQAAQSQMAIAEQSLQAEKSMADARMTIQRASVEQRLESDLSFAERDKEIKLQGNTAEIAALDKSSKDYQNQLKALRDGQLGIEAAYSASVAGLRSRADVEQYQRDLANTEQNEREKINATDQGSSERLAAIDSAIKAAEAMNLQETDYYRQLGLQRVETVRQGASEEAKLKADAGRESADNATKMGELELQAQQTQIALQDSSRRVTDQQRMSEALAAAQQEFEIKRQGLQQQAAALDTSAKDYQNKLQAINNKELQLVKAHENEKTQIQTQATMSRNQRVLGAETQFEQSLARGLSSVITGQQNFASMMNGIFTQVASGMLQNAMMAIMSNDMTKPSDAAKAARKAFGWGWERGGASAPVLAPVLAAGAFASVMAFSAGTDSVPGVGNFDSVPAMLTPGEGVVPGGVMDGLRKVASNGGGFQGGGAMTHIHVRYSPQVTAIDSTGVQKMLKTHGREFAKEFHSQVRRTNR